MINILLIFCVLAQKLFVFLLPGGCLLQHITVYYSAYQHIHEVKWGLCFSVVCCKSHKVLLDSVALLIQAQTVKLERPNTHKLHEMSTGYSFLIKPSNSLQWNNLIINHCLSVKGICLVLFTFNPEMLITLMTGSSSLVKPVNCSAEVVSHCECRDQFS